MRSPFSPIRSVGSGPRRKTQSTDRRRTPRHLPIQLEVLESRQLLSTITEFSSSIAGSTLRPEAITFSGGKIYFTSPNTGQIGVVDTSNPSAGVQSVTNPPSSIAISDITTGANGSIWYSDYGSSVIGRLGQTPVDLPSGTFPARPTSLVAGPDGAMWYTDTANNILGRVDSAGNVNPLTITAHNQIGFNSLTSQIVSAAGQLWFTEYDASGSTPVAAVGAYNPTLNQWVPSIQIPQASGMKPVDIILGSDNSIWVSLVNVTNSNVVTAAELARIDPTTHAVTEFPFAATPDGIPYPYRITTGGDGNIWFADPVQARVYEFDIASHGLTSSPAPATIQNTAGGSPINNPTPKLLAVATGSDGIVWYTDKNGAIGQVIQASQLSIHSQPPTSLNANTPFGLVIYATTSGGVLDTSFNGDATVSLVNNPGGSTLGGTLKVPITNGVATFSGLTLNKAGNGYTLQVSTNGLTSTPPTTAISVSSTVQGATHFVIQAQPPASLNAGTAFSVVVRAVNDAGAVDTTFAGSVSIALASNPGGSTLGGGTFTVAAVQGVATFSGLTLDKAGNGYTLNVTASGLTSATTAAINVIQPATKLVIVSQPSNVTTGSGFSVVVQAVNDAGAVDPTFNGNVTIALAGGAGGLGGTTTVQAVNGVATFGNLTLANAGNSLALVVSSTGLTGTNSTAITAQNPIPPSPVVVSASIVMNPPKKKRGKATFGGFQIVFSSAMDGASLNNGGNYTLRALVQVTQKVGKKKVKSLQPNNVVPFSLQIVNSTTIRLVTTNTKVFKLGGQIKLIGTAPGGLKSSAGGYLGSVGGAVLTFNISKNAKSIAPA
ncbi:virginiamycin B lyase family protein [Aquisphaera insulae]|uniref:virginiamycin B lyase family protein n=1 Tax=Aquisphaera insulae TaxID=2712864 RepID=UPI0013ED50EC|nr:hypothetical protein [Aquisphaera insulae]